MNEIARKPEDQSQRDYQRIEQALHYLAANYQAQPDLHELASSVDLSEAHFQKLFKKWAGVSPKQFLQYLTLEHARQCLSDNMSVLESAYDSGLAAPARLNELFVRIESITPAEFKNKGEGIEIDYGFHASPFGRCLIGVSDRGVTGIEFSENQEQALRAMKQRLPAAAYAHHSQRTSPYIDLIFGVHKENKRPRELSLLLRGTAFQLKVWEALLRIPAGARVSYRQLAELVDQPTASRAVGTAVGKNPIAVLIPCHRVIREDGMLGGYHWGLERKLALLGVESIQRSGAGVRESGPVRW